MARPLRLQFPGAVYHLTSRGNARQKVFFTDADRELFLKTLTGVVRRYDWVCHAYCLMADHYHLLVETPKANLSIGMRQLNGIYTQSFNRRHNRTGHLFQGRFKAILVERQSPPVGALPLHRAQSRSERRNSWKDNAIRKPDTVGVMTPWRDIRYAFLHATLDDRFPSKPQGCIEGRSAQIV